VLAGIRRRDLCIVTHPEMLPVVRDRHAGVEASFGLAAAEEASTEESEGGSAGR
jgi:hypothetical protein